MNYICISFNTKLVYKILRFFSLTLSVDLPAVLGSQFWDGLSWDRQLFCSLNWLCTIMSTHHSKLIVIENIYRFWFNFVILTLALYLIVSHNPHKNLTYPAYQCFGKIQHQILQYQINTSLQNSVIVETAQVEAKLIACTCTLSPKLYFLPYLRDLHTLHPCHAFPYPTHRKLL